MGASSVHCRRFKSTNTTSVKLDFTYEDLLKALDDSGTVLNIKNEGFKNFMPKRHGKENTNETTSINIPTDWNRASAHAQRIAGRSLQPDNEGDEKGIGEAEKSGLRLRGNGPVGVPRRVIRQ